MSPQVLVLSPPRMGTQSIADALVILGYPKVYHMREVGKHGHAQQWADLVNAKYNDPEVRLGRTDLEPLLGDFDALADFPAAIFAQELICAYPNAKVILLLRDEDAWLSSMMRTLGSDKHNDEERKKSPMQPLRDAYHRNCWKNDLPSHGREYFRNYQEVVRAQVPSDNLLEYPIDGSWEPLCHFLQKDIPATPYPNRDDHREWRKA